MPTTVTAQAGDTLCTLAINNSFTDCLPLRALDANSAYLTRALVPGDVVTLPDLNPSENDRASDNQHNFQIKNRTVGIRFVHGSPNLPYDQDLSLIELNISNFTTTLAGISEGSTLPPDTSAVFNANAHVDLDAFKVEVIETRPPGNQLEVVIEALLPTYDPGGILSDHTNFDGSQDPSTVRGARTLITQAINLRNKCFRTGYLRLVVDKYDNQALAAQTLLVTDMVEQGNDQVEILDQDIRATYVLQDCPSSDPGNKCKVVASVPLNRGKTVNLALHILRATPTGVVETNAGGPGDDGVVQIYDLQSRVSKFCRRYWAQDQVRFKILSTQTVDLPSNMICVSDASGNPAAGHVFNATTPSQVGFTVSVQRFGNGDDLTQDVPPVTINAGDSPEATANNIAAAIGGVPGLSARVSVNPVETRQASGASQLGSADILISDAQNGRVTITNLSGPDVQDQDQIVMVCNLSLTFSTRNALDDYHVGSPHERNLYKTLDTGDDRLDIFVVQNFDSLPNLIGFTVCAQTDCDVSRRPMTGMVNSIVMRADGSDVTETWPYALPHEIGHALLDCAQHADGAHQLMFATTTNFGGVNDAKRLVALDPPTYNWTNLVTDPSNAVYGQKIMMNTVSRLQSKAAGLMN